jgi:hypothetical protein
MAWPTSGRASPNTLYALDPETGAASAIGLTGSSIVRISAMALSDDGVMYAVGWRPDAPDAETGVLYSLFKANFMEQATYFGTIDPVTGVATVVGPTADGMAALAWGPGGRPPHAGPPPHSNAPPHAGPPPHCD